MQEYCDLCGKPGKFSIRRIKTGKWLGVCGSHDNFIGVENLELQGETRANAILINREVKKEV